MDVRLRSLGGLSALPDELLNVALLFLSDEADLVRLGSASRVLRVLCGEDALWAHFCLKDHVGAIVYKVRHDTTMCMHGAQVSPCQADEGNEVRSCMGHRPAPVSWGRHGSLLNQEGPLHGPQLWSSHGPAMAPSHAGGGLQSCNPPDRRWR